MQGARDPRTDWNDLRYFLAVAREGTLAGAARALRVDHSTVFRRLNACEQRLGARLFERLAGTYELTDAGRSMLERVEHIDAEVSAIEREVAGRDVHLAGVVRLTTADNLAHTYLPGYLAELGRLHPDIRVELVVGGEAYDLSRREADVALRATSRPPEHLVGRRVVSLPWGVCAGETYLARAGRPESMADLATHRLIGPDDRMLHLPAFAWARRHLPATCIAATANDLITMAALAEAGMGLALLPGDLVRPGLVRLFPMTPAFTSQIWLLTHPDLRAVARVRAVMEFLTEQLRADPRLAGTNASDEKRGSQQ